MKVVKLSRKDKLDQLVALLTIRLGKKVQQQDVLDACVEFALNQVDKLEILFLDKPQISETRLNEILSSNLEFSSKKSTFLTERQTIGTNDELLYGDDA